MCVCACFMSVWAGGDVVCLFLSLANGSNDGMWTSVFVCLHLGMNFMGCEVQCHCLWEGGDKF